ncbi:MAG: biopolymer transporter ExbD [Rikenellaceae bacterium]
MAIKRGSKVDMGSSSASMTDLMFLLLIFLLIATTLINSNALKLDLPKSTSLSKDKVTVIVSITADREFYVEQDRVDFANLEAAVKAQMESADEKRISLRVDKSVPAEDIVKVMNLAKRNEYKLNLATNPE